MKSVVNDIGDKYCPSCDTFKTLKEYNFSKRSKLKVQTYCRECCATKKIEYRATSNYQRTRREHDLLRKYRLTTEGYQSLFDAQDGKCPICLRTLHRDNKTHVDHCHTTGKARGLLCHGCNASLGKLGDTADTLQRAIDYIKKAGMA